MLQCRLTYSGYGAVFCHCSSVEQLAICQDLLAKHFDGDLIGSNFEYSGTGKFGVMSNGIVKHAIILCMQACCRYFT